MWGKLNLHAFDHDLIQTGGALSIVFGTLFAIGLITYLGKWKTLWKDWITSLDPKKIGIMYIVVLILMLFKGVIDALMMRAHQMFSVGDMQGYLSADHYQQIFTAHGTTMIFFVGMGVVFGTMNLIIPLQIGARDVAFPFLNAVSFWLFAAGAALLLVSLIIGDFSAAGWIGYPPLSGLKYSPGVGVDYWIWTIQIAGVGSLLSGINFIVTIFKLRCPGMTLMKMPIFVWSSLCALVLIIFAFPVLTATLLMLSLDRLLDMHFFTADFGGNPMMYINLIWAWGHPEVYILILPAFGIFSEVVPVFAQKKLFGYASMVWALVAITFLSFIVWLHHFFTMGAGPKVNAFFGIMTMLIAVPTGVKIFNWLFTLFRGRVIFDSPMLWFLGFAITFAIGGMAGVLMSIPAVDFQMHNSLFLVAHFHSVIIGGVLFGFFSGFSYWFPKFTGFKLHETLGKYAFVCWFFGFLIAFLPLYILGIMGATRRLNHYEASTGWQPFFWVAAFGALMIGLGILFQILQIIVSIKQKKLHEDSTGDPWNGRTLEWSTVSPPHEYNFAILPEVHEQDAFWHAKEHRLSLASQTSYEALHLPKNSSLGVWIGAFGFLFSFCIVWHIFWLACLSVAGVLGCMILRLFDQDTEFTLSTKDIEQLENQRGLH